MKNILPFLLLTVAVNVPNFANADKKFPLLNSEYLHDGARGKQNVNPCQNFYQFACGEWIKKTPVPPGVTQVTVTDAAEEETEAKLASIIYELSTHSGRISAGGEKQVADLYNSCMHLQSNNTAETTYFKEMIGKIKSISNQQQLAFALAKMHLAGAQAFFGVTPDLNTQNPSKVIGTLIPTGISLPEAALYLAEDVPIAQEAMASYKKHLVDVFRNLGETNFQAQQHAAVVLSLETLFALLHKKVETKQKSDNQVMSLEELSGQYSNFDWETYFTTLGVNAQSIQVSRPIFFQNLNAIVGQLDLETVQTYLIWSFVNAIGYHVSPAFETTDFAFWQDFVGGQEHPEKRKKYCVKVVKETLPDALAEAYSNSSSGVGVANKTKVKEMIYDIKESFRQNVNALASAPSAWIDPVSRAAALAKLQRMGEQVGAPSTWPDFSGIKTDPDNFLVNLINCHSFTFSKELKQINKSVSRSNWDMQPWEMNAVYSPLKNKFFIPAGYLKRPLFDAKMHRTMNPAMYTIGHELMHAYNTVDSDADEFDLANDWKTPYTKRKFKERTRCFIEQANNYIIAGKHVDGIKTLDENLSDHGGIKLAYMALQRSKAHREEGQTWLNKYNDNQQFWISYAQAWCSKATPENQRLLLKEDEHPPAEFRVNTVLMNTPEFAKDFNCKVTDRMNPAARCTLW